MSKIAFIYPGQGAQVCGMGQDFYEQTKEGKETFDLATDILGFSVPELCFTENDRLDITEYTQAAMVTTSIAMTKVLEAQGVKPDVTAGLSLGEYCALYAAGVMSEKDAIATVRQRGILMQQAVPAGQGAMAAFLEHHPGLYPGGAGSRGGARLALPACGWRYRQHAVVGHCDGRCRLPVCDPYRRRNSYCSDHDAGRHGHRTGTGIAHHVTGHQPAVADYAA